MMKRRETKESLLPYQKEEDNRDTHNNIRDDDMLLIVRLMRVLLSLLLLSYRGKQMRQDNHPIPGLIHKIEPCPQL